jgi:hypothetical protein
MHLHFRRSLLTLGTYLSLLCLVPPALPAQSVAQCVATAGSCGANIAKTQLNALVGAEKVLEFAAANPNCVADIISSNFVTIGIASAMTSLAATGVLKQDGNSYLKYVYGQGAKPMVQAISKLVPAPPLTNLLEQEGGDALGKAFEAITYQIPMPSAGAPNLNLQLICGDAVAVAGMGMVENLKKVIGSAKAAVKTCSAAASCFATVLVDIVKDPVGSVGSAGEFVLDGADDIKDFVFGGCKNTPVQDYFNGRFKPRTNEIAYQTVWGGQPGYYGPLSRALVDQCVKDYDSCDSDKDTAKRQCVVMSSGAVQTDGNGWIAGKGLEQLVRTRELELGIPKTLDTMAEWADAQQPERIKATLQAVFGDVAGPLKSKFPKPETYQASQVAVRKAAVRKILGVSGNSKPTSPDQKISLPQGSIGALMMGYVETEGPANAAWSYKTGQLLAKYYPELSGNPKLLAQVDEIATKSLVGDKNLLLSLNGEAWNKDLAKAEMDKIANGNPAIKGQSCATGDEACVKKVKDITTAYELVLVSLGRADSFAGMGAWGVTAPAYQEYQAYLSKARAAAVKVMADSTPNYGKPEITGAATVPGLAAAIDLAKPSKTGMQPLPSAPSVADQSNALQHAPGAVQTSAPGLPSAAPASPPIGRPPRPLGMPGLPTMGTLPTLPRMAAAISPVAQQVPPQVAQQVAAATGNAPQTVPAAPVDEPPQAITRTTPSLRIPPTIANAVPPTLPPPMPAATGMQPLGNVANDIAVSNRPAIRIPGAAVVPAFNAQAYRTERNNALSDKWTSRCKGNASCQQSINQMINQRLEAELQAVSANRPSYGDKPALAQYLALQDQRFDPQFEAAIPKSAVVLQPNFAQPIVAPNTNQALPRVGPNLPKIRQ